MTVISTHASFFVNAVSPLLAKLPPSSAPQFLFENGVDSNDVSALYVHALKVNLPIADDLKNLYTRNPSLSSAPDCRRAVARILEGLPALRASTEAAEEEDEPRASPRLVPSILAKKASNPPVGETREAAASSVSAREIETHVERAAKIIDASVAAPRNNLALMKRVLVPYDVAGPATPSQKAAFWKALLQDPRFFASMNRLIPMSSLPKDEKEKESLDAYHVILRPYLAALPLFLGEGHCGVSPLVTRWDSFAARQVAKYQKIEHNVMNLTAASCHGENLGYMLTCDPNTSPICGTLLTCLAPLNSENPDDFFLRSGMKDDLDLIRDVFLFVSREASIEGACDFRFLENFWRPVMRTFLFSDSKKTCEPGRLFYKLLALLKKNAETSKSEKIKIGRI